MRQPSQPIGKPTRLGDSRDHDKIFRTVRAGELHDQRANKALLAHERARCVEHERDGNIEKRCPTTGCTLGGLDSVGGSLGRNVELESWFRCAKAEPNHQSCGASGPLPEIGSPQHGATMKGREIAGLLMSRQPFVGPCFDHVAPEGVDPIVVRREFAAICTSTVPSVVEPAEGHQQGCEQQPQESHGPATAGQHHHHATGGRTDECGGGQAARITQLRDRAERRERSVRQLDRPIRGPLERNDSVGCDSFGPVDVDVPKPKRRGPEADELMFADNHGLGAEYQDGVAVDHPGVATQPLDRHARCRRNINAKVARCQPRIVEANIRW